MQRYTYPGQGGEDNLDKMVRTLLRNVIFQGHPQEMIEEVNQRVGTNHVRVDQVSEEPNLICGADWR